MDRYKSHKIVEAGKITGIEQMEGVASATITIESGGNFRVGSNWVLRAGGVPDISKIVGGYYVRYEDGFESWSPAEAFEQGYTRLSMIPPEEMKPDRKAQVEAIAHIAHEVNRSYCKSIGDESQPEWKDAPDWQKESIIKGVLFHLENPDADAEASHESWLEVKRAEGWSYGPEKDPIARRHPCFLPYKELPEAQRIKDYLFRNVVHGCLQFVKATG